MTDHLTEENSDLPLSVHTYPWLTTKAQELIDALSAARAENASLETEANKLALQVASLCETRGKLRAENEMLKGLLLEGATEGILVNYEEWGIRARAALAPEKKEDVDG